MSSIQQIPTITGVTTTDTPVTITQTPTLPIVISANKTDKDEHLPAWWEFPLKIVGGIFGLIIIIFIIMSIYKHLNKNKLKINLEESQGE
jgi:hypothetical protein